MGYCSSGVDFPGANDGEKSCVGRQSSYNAIKYSEGSHLNVSRQKQEKLSGIYGGYCNTSVFGYRRLSETLPIQISPLKTKRKSGVLA